MRKLVSCALSLVFFAEGMMFYNHYSYAHHVNQARNDLNELEEILEGKSQEKALGASILGMYEVENDFGEIKLRNLTKKIVNSTVHAIENADDITQVTKLKKAVDEITDIQEVQITMITNVLEKVKTDYISREVETAYNKAIDLQEKVGQANLEIQAAIDNNQHTIEIDIITNSSNETHESPDDHEEKEIKHSALTPKRNANLERIEREKQEDAAQRKANRKRIQLIEKGNNAHKAQGLKNKLSKVANTQS